MLKTRLRSRLASRLTTLPSAVVYDVDALDYFTRAEALGGSFDQTAIGGYDSDFSAGTDGWNAAPTNVSPAGNIDAIGGMDDNLSITSNTVNGGHFVGRGSTLENGNDFDISFDYYIPSSNSHCDGLRFTSAANGIDVSVTSPSQDTWNSFSTSGTADGGTVYLWMLDGGSTGFEDPGGDDVIYIRNIRVRNTAYATYTETYVKTAFNDYVLGLKADAVWSKVTELYPLAGVTFGGLMAKLKYDTTATLTNNNFVTGDYLAAGSGAGLKGDGSTKYLKGGISQIEIPSRNSHLSTYNTQFSTGVVYMGSESALDIDRLAIYAAATSLFYSDLTGATSISTITGSQVGHMVGTIESQESLYENGSLIKQEAIAGTARTPQAIDTYLFAMNRNGVAAFLANFRSCCFSVGLGLTDTEAANLSTRTNALMTALGANVY